MTKTLSRLLAQLLFGVSISGRENLPAGESIVAGVPHRNWVEPSMLLGLFPRRTRLTIVADGPTAVGSRLRRTMTGLVGEVIPVWPGSGPAGFKAIAASAHAAIRSGAVVVIFPEVPPARRPPELRKLSAGLAHIAARSQAKVVPVVFGGTHELYLRRRIVVRILPALAPPTGTGRAEIATWMNNFRALCQAAADEVHADAESRGPRFKLARWLTGRYPRAG